MKKFLIIIVTVIVAVWGWYALSLRPVDAEDGSRSFSVEKGANTEEIAKSLKEKGIIKSRAAFVLHAKFSGAEGKLQAGKFAVSRSMTTQEIVSTLLSGKGEQAVITIPEGFTVSEIDALLTEREFIEEGEINKCAIECDFSSFTFLPDGKEQADRGGRIEGYLFPDTYYVEPEGFVAKFFLERLLTTFEKGLLEDISDKIPPERSLHQIVTMASLIEKETITDEERRIVSDILWKRFDENRGLGVDATVRYILNKPTEPITHADLNTNDPYNTRKFRGLPPGPIASPGLKSIEATLNPKQSPYFYYLHEPSGQIHYAVTNEEHNRNRMLYLSGKSE